MKPVTIMGVLNVTPDSFSDGGHFLDVDVAYTHAKKMLAQGAHIIDIGGESSRPYAKEVSLAEELNRILPVIQKLKDSDNNISISVDSYKPKVMSVVLDQGVNMINDIYGFSNPASLEVVADYSCDLCIMHMKGTPQTMQNNPTYSHIMDELKAFFNKKLTECAKHNIDSNRIIIDPGFGFGKTFAHNITIIQHLAELTSLGVKLLIGISNKSIFDTILGGREVGKRVAASTAFNQIAIEKGADFIRTHHPRETADMIEVLKHIHPKE